MKASRSASANAPTVTLTAPAGGSQLPAGPFQVSWTGSDQDGDPLTYSLLYSNDGGATWETLATDLTGSELELNTDQLPGGSGKLRVVVSDGFLSGQDTSGDAQRTAAHAPSVQIVSPSLKARFSTPPSRSILQGVGLRPGRWDAGRCGFRLVLEHRRRPGDRREPEHSRALHRHARDHPAWSPTATG